MPKSEIRKLLQEIKKQVDNPGNSSTTEIKKWLQKLALTKKLPKKSTIYSLNFIKPLKNTVESKNICIPILVG